MKISNSSLTSFWTCPLKFQEEYIFGLKKPNPWFAFGTRWHQYMEFHYCEKALPEPVYNLYYTEADELVCASMFESYKAYYPVENFEIVDCEKKFELEVAPDTFFVGKIDMLVRDKSSGLLSVFETKTESRGSKRNLPEAWAVRTQASLYCWAAQQLYSEPIDHVLLNVCTKPSPKGNIGPTFRRDLLERTSLQILEATDNLSYVTDQIARMTDNKSFPANRNACVSEQGYRCDFYSLHTIGRSDELLSQFEQSTPYSYLEL